MKEKNEVSEKSAWAFANTILTIQFLILLAVTAVFIAVPDFVVSFLTQWRADADPGKYALAVSSVRMMAPVLIGLLLGSTTYALLNGYKRFFLAALGDAAWKFCTIAVLVVGFLFTKDGVQLLVWGLVAGSVCKVLTHLAGLRDKLPEIRPRLALSHPAIKTLGLLMLPLVVGVLATNGRDFINNIYILSALDTSGLIQANDIGKKLFSTFSFLVPYTLSIAVFPFLCELANDKDNQKTGELVTRFGRMMLAVFTPLALFIAVMAVPFTSLIFKGGYFDEESVRLTAISLACYMFALPAAAIDPLMNTTFFANRKMVSVTVIGVTFSLMSVGISWLGLQVYQQTHNELHLLAFIAGGFALTRAIKCIVLVEILKRKIPMFPFAETTLFLARVSVAAAVAGGAAWLLLRQISALSFLSGRIGEVIQLGACAAVFGILYLACAYFLRIREIREVFALALQKVKSRGQK
jgi:putative peptidoglycan lipid II flippase